jgi:hypothetical protein
MGMCLGQSQNLQLQTIKQNSFCCGLNNFFEAKLRSGLKNMENWLVPIHLAASKTHIEAIKLTLSILLAPGNSNNLGVMANMSD